MGWLRNFVLGLAAIALAACGAARGITPSLRLPAAELTRAGIRAGDLLVATEGGASTIDVRCAAACTVRYVAAGPAIAHAEGHIVFTSS